MPHRWTTADFDHLSWHDCHVHGFRLRNVKKEYGSADLELDIDFLLEWLLQPDRTYRFRIAPATLTFHDVFGLRVRLDYATPTAGMTPFSLAGVEREPVTYPTGFTSYRWRLPINWPSGEISFEGPGFTQVLRGEPRLNNSQCLAASERCG